MLSAPPGTCWAAVLAKLHLMSELDQNAIRNYSLTCGQHWLSLASSTQRSTTRFCSGMSLS